MQGLPFPCEEQSPTLRGSEVGRGDTQDGTCGMAQANSALAARVPELEAASGQREAPETSSEEADKGITLQDQDEPQRRSWLHRLLIHT